MKSPKFMLWILVLACLLMPVLSVRADSFLQRPPPTAEEVAALVALCGAPAEVRAMDDCADTEDAYWWAIYHIGVEQGLYDTDGTPTAGKYLYNGSLSISLAVQAQMITAWGDRMRQYAAFDYHENAVKYSCTYEEASEVPWPNTYPPNSTDPWIINVPDWFTTPRDPLTPTNLLECIEGYDGALAAARADLLICFDSCTTNCPDCVADYYSQVATIKGIFSDCLNSPTFETEPTCPWDDGWPADPENKDPPCTVPGVPGDIIPGDLSPWFNDPYNRPGFPPRPILPWSPTSPEQWFFKYLQWWWDDFNEYGYHLFHCSIYDVDHLSDFDATVIMMGPGTFSEWNSWYLYTGGTSPQP